jgi:NAD(P)-dependent dehydrogenase (short-subunit alcohol dehydrogenase family)
MDLEMDNRVVLVTGGTDGLGLALARRLVAEGARVAICGRDSSRLASATQELDAGDSVLGVETDVTDPDALERFVTAAHDRWGRVDGLVNNAGAHAAGAFADLTDDDWDADFDLKLRAAIRTSRLAHAHLRDNGGSIVNILNVFAKTPDAGTMPTSVSRAATMALTKALSRELAPEGIRVNAVLVGFVESGQWRRLADGRNTSTDALAREIVEHYRIPFGRIGRGEEFADLVTFLLSPRAGYISGTAVNLDGGLCAAV